MVHSSTHHTPPSPHSESHHIALAPAWHHFCSFLRFLNLSLFVPSMVGRDANSSLRTLTPLSQMRSKPPTRLGVRPWKCCSMSTHVSMSSSTPNLRSWSVCVSLLMLGLALTSMSHGLSCSSIMTSYPYISKQCLSLMITLATARKEFRMMFWMPAKHSFTASDPCLVMRYRLSCPMPHLRSVLPASYVSSFFCIAWFVRWMYGLSTSSLALL
mmetsp:Transcript_5417/g.13748  ORF Transcript_5417/g.13748 Transcript_5417/m.13748 type:complete len:213 (+) Transcript_5417:138-776(+)